MFRDSSGYEMVGDLLNNADRRASRGYYDDAVSRIYRAVELFAQTRLKTEHGLDSGDMKLENLPDSLRLEYKGRVRDYGRIMLGLRDDYLLLNRLNDPVGIAYKRVEKRFDDALTRRNTSIGAHGINPLGREDYVFADEILRGFIVSTARESEIDIFVPQMPREIHAAQ